MYTCCTACSLDIYFPHNSNFYNLDCPVLCLPEGADSDILPILCAGLIAYDTAAMVWAMLTERRMTVSTACKDYSNKLCYKQQKWALCITNDWLIYIHRNWEGEVNSVHETTEPLLVPASKNMKLGTSLTVIRRAMKDQREVGATSQSHMYVPQKLKGDANWLMHH